MTNEEIDKRVTEEVMGLEVKGLKVAIPWNSVVASYEKSRGYQVSQQNEPLFYYANILNYSTDMNAAMLVVDKMRERGFPWFMVRYDAARPENAKRWTAVFQWRADSFRGDSYTPAMAICLAALEAVKR